MNYSIPFEFILYNFIFDLDIYIISSVLAGLCILVMHTQLDIKIYQKWNPNTSLLGKQWYNIY